MRRRNYRSRGASPVVIQSFKKVLNDAPTSRVPATNIVLNLAKGVDSVAAGQTGVIDADVPTGCVIRSIEIQWSYANLSGGNCFIHTTIQKLRSGQGGIAANLVGGNPQRNQVFHQTMRSIGTDQNGNAVFRLKIPKMFQRMREGDVWQFSRTGTAVYTDALQVIYKFYR